ncbi:MAG: IPTL-CTERM sorting domain-containing protein [Thiomonas sp.]|uniref:IPTL-CTERM sorting domain-containing protein n=1 Tax=Thiomonas sp. TaxID=2047785 RepID=UPI002A362D8A|nr:IPTL-CTERM sorting domain-containing protein [Thiomonas sp.]MDY0331689.1 IPTL-CTERM sorting domain-containing protein [Thiomonas sp.]
MRFFSSLLILAALFAFSNAAFAADADLVTNQNVSPIQGPAGGTFTYTITTTNAGPDTATGVALTDTLPSGAQFVSVSTSAGTCSQSGGVVNCALPDIAAGTTGVTTTIQVILPTDGVYTNTISGTTTATDPNPSNNTDIAKSTTAYAAADLQMNASASSTTVVAGQPFTYNLSVKNNGPDDVSSGGSISISFQVPSGSTINQVSGSGWACTPSSGYPLSSGTITCTAAALANGATSSGLTVQAVANQTGSLAAAFSTSAKDSNGNAMPDGNTNNNTASVTVDVSTGSDVSITGSASPNPVALNGTATYTLTPRFNGGVAPGSTGNQTITVIATPGTGLTYVSGSASGSGWTCQDSGQGFACTRQGPYTGGNYTNMPQITYQAQATQAGTLSTDVSISAPEPDPVPANNSATINITSSNTADLSIGKYASLNPVVVGQGFDYGLYVVNNGPLPVASGQTIAVTDNIPTGITLTGAPSGNGWTCSAPATPAAGPVTVTCTMPGPLAVNGTAPGIDLPVILTAAGSTTNTATVALSGTGPTDDNANNNSSSVSVLASSTSADLSISKTASGNVDAGQPLTYTITVTNNGPDASTNVVMSDKLSNLIANGGLQSVTTTQGACTPAAPANGDDQNVQCQLGTLNVGASATVVITVLPSIAVTGTRSNTATVYSSDVGDPVQSNNTATANSTVTAVVDLALTKTATPSSVPAGAPLTYQVTVKNNGPSTAQAVAMTDNLPVGATFIRVSNVSNGGSCPTAPAAGASGGQLVCNWTSIPSGAQYTVTYQIRPTTAGTTVTNNASVTTTTKESNLNNNSASTSTPVTPAQLDLSITKSHTPDPVALGANTTYTITVRNAGPSQDTNVVMTDVFPDDTQQQSAIFSYAGGLTVDQGGTCTAPAVGATSGQVVCTFPTLDQGQTATITYQAKADAITKSGALSGTEISHASVKGDLTETTMANNSVLDYTTAYRTSSNADLAITKALTSPASGYLTAGATAVYQIHVTNHGPAASQGAEVVDTLPSNLQFVSATGGCVYSAGTVTCNLGSIPSGTSQDFEVTAKVAASYNGATPIVNTAKVDAPGDPNLGNNSASVQSKVANSNAIPTVSEWGMLIMGLFMSLTGLWYFGRRKI